MRRLDTLPKELLDQWWPQVENLLAKGLLACEGELDISQLRLLIVQGQVQVVLFLDEEDLLVGALGFEIVAYPNYRVANIVSFGGEGLLAGEGELEQFKTGLRRWGVSKIQGWCRPAQARLFQKQFGATTPYQMIRIELEGD